MIQCSAVGKWPYFYEISLQRIYDKCIYFINLIKPGAPQGTMAPSLGTTALDFHICHMNSSKLQG